MTTEQQPAVPIYAPSEDYSRQQAELPPAAVKTEAEKHAQRYVHLTGQQPGATEYRCLNSTCGSRRNPNKVGDGVLSCPRCGHAVELVQPAASAERAVEAKRALVGLDVQRHEGRVQDTNGYWTHGIDDWVRASDYDLLRASLAEREKEIETARRTGAYWKDELLAANATIAANHRLILELAQAAKSARTYLSQFTDKTVEPVIMQLDSALLGGSHPEEGRE